MRQFGTAVLAIMCIGPLGCDASPVQHQTTTPSGSAATGDSTPGANGDVSSLKASINSKALQFKSASSYSYGGRALDIVFSTAALSCDDIRGVSPNMVDREQYVELSAGPLLQPDGSAKWGLTKLYFSNRSDRRRGLGSFNVKSAAKGISGDTSFKFEVEKNERMKVPARKLVVAGSFSTQDCGVFPQKDEPAVRAQPDLTLSVAGQPFKVQGATVRPTNFPQEGHALVLSTGPASCARADRESDLSLKFTFAQERAVYVRSGGRLLPIEHNASLSPRSDTFTAKATDSLEGSDSVDIKLSGSVDIGGYTVALGGKVSALRCPREP